MPFMDSQMCVRVLSPPKLLLTLWLCVLLCTVSVRGDYEFTIHFYEFRNPLGLQCGECDSGGPPACCDDVNRTENCTNNAPYTCDTRFRFMLRPFGASVKTAPSGGFPHHTPSNGGNSETFNEGPGGFVGSPNPFTITSTSEWTGRVQFFSDALDRVVRQRKDNETEAIIDRFPIDLELKLGANFTERTTYTGIYNISGLEFDMSFRVQCSENFYGPSCTTFCEPLEGLYNCSREGKMVCIQGGQNITKDSYCALCLDHKTNCSACMTDYDFSTDCPTQTTTTTTTASTTSTNTNTSSSGMATTNTVSGDTSSTFNLPLVGGAVGGAAVLLILLLVVLCVVIVVMTLQLRRQRRKFTVAGTITGLNNAYFSRDSSVREGTETAKLGEHDFDNPLYDESKQNGSQWEADNSAYSKLQRPPVQKSFVPPKFPYTMEHTEEMSYQLDVAGKGADDVINNEHPAYDIAYPPPPPPSFNELGGAYDVTSHPNHHQFLGASPSALAGGIYNLANYPEQSVYDDADLPPSGSTRLPRNDYADITDIPGSTATTYQVPQHDYADIPDPQSSSKEAPHYDYADTALSMSSPPPPAANDPTAVHEYAETDDVMKGSHDTSKPPSVAYANTTPGQVTPEAMEHYDLGH